jgi:5-methylcytosine-specific restriction endonuclease McrA
LSGERRDEWRGVSAGCRRAGYERRVTQHSSHLQAAAIPHAAFPRDNRHRGATFLVANSGALRRSPHDDRMDHFWPRDVSRGAERMPGRSEQLAQLAAVVRGCATRQPVTTAALEDAGKRSWPRPALEGRLLASLPAGGSSSGSSPSSSELAGGSNSPPGPRSTGIDCGIGNSGVADGGSGGNISGESGFASSSIPSGCSERGPKTGPIGTGWK